MPDRRTLEQRLRDSQEYNRRLVEATAAPLLVVDARLGITDVNEQAVALTGVPRQELVGTPIETRFSMASPSVEAVRRTVQTGEASVVDAIVHPPRGEERSLSVSASGYVDPLGDRRGLLLLGTRRVGAGAERTTAFTGRDSPR
ncbi:MAG TPA: PAS domain-containing protein [Thermoplasmata archaeon]|jgi:PAS domain S-box-containing protein|nr:PAS domain-containing protein [Thermoplasmata archaeon]